MIFLLEHLEGGDSITLPEEKDYVLGRKNCDILILNDQSISREHARLRVKDGSVTLEDSKSRYQTLYNGSKLEPFVPVNLKHMDLIHFGILQSKFRFECPTFIVSASGLSTDTKTILKQHLKVCNSKYMDKWSSVCTHLVVEKLTLTVKVLHALVQGKPIVTLDYWADYAKAIKNSRPAPDLSKYRKPPVAEHLFSSDFECTYDERRKSLFENKMFVFLKASTKKQLEDVIKSCGKFGGSCFSWDEEPKTVSDISTSPLEHLLIKSDNDEDGDESFQVLVKSMAKQKKRMIPVNEIALAIVSCSCDVNCNPSFNKAAQVFAVPDDKTQLGNVLVGETQTQPAFSKSLAVETEKAIPESLPPDHWVRKVDAQPKPLKRLNGKEIESPLCKKPKLDNNTSKPTKWISLDQSINLPKRQENTSEASRIMANSTLQSQKRKASDDAEKCLKINPFTNMSTPASKKSKTGSANPFALFKPISKPTRPETARKSSNPFASIMSTNRPTPTVKMEEIEIENSPPPESRLESTRNISVHSAISIKQLSVNFRWISKSLPSVHSVKANTDDDPELLEISKALRDCIQVTTFSVHERPTPPINKTQNSVGERNFKKFKKVKPLRPQVTVISYHQLERVGPGDISKISLNENFSDDEPEPIRSRKFPNVKPVGKRFIL
ncbi:hypothetical protein HUJ05_004142 [Dendroctonus ponderosae]|nr:hypothetical protein HUJ05_004142 [Dendroctonus ponderosae]